MAVNNDQPARWKGDIACSVDFYNDWFIRFAPKTYRDARRRATEQVEMAFVATDNLRRLHSTILRDHPKILSILRMATAPPLARDRLIGLAQVTPSLVKTMKDGKILPRMATEMFDAEVTKIVSLAQKIVRYWHF